MNDNSKTSDFSQASIKDYIPNTAAIPNIIFDYWMPRLTGSTFKILMAIARKTYGWRKEIDAISVKRLEIMTGLGRRSVFDAVKELTELGLISKIKSKTIDGDDAANKYVIHVDCEGSEIQEEVQNLGGGGAKSAPGVVQNLHPLINPISLEYPLCNPAHARIDCGKVDKSICRAPLVFTTDDEHKKLVKVHGEDFIQKAYIHLSEWKQDTPKVKWKGNDYRSILRWVIDVIRDKDLKKKDLPINQEENHSLAQHISVKYQGRKERDIVIGQDYLEFINGPQCEHIKYKDKDFTERVKHQLNKRGLDTEWIKWLKD